MTELTMRWLQLLLVLFPLTPYAGASISVDLDHRIVTLATPSGRLWRLLAAEVTGDQVVGVGESVSDGTVQKVVLEQRVKNCRDGIGQLRMTTLGTREVDEFAVTPWKGTAVADILAALLCEKAGYVAAGGTLGGKHE